MKISQQQLHQIIQEVINEEMMTEGRMRELFGEFENDVMELVEDGQVHIDDIITMFKSRYEPMGLGPEDMNGMMDIMIEAGLLTNDGSSGFYTTSDDEEGEIYDDPNWMGDPGQPGGPEDVWLPDYEGDEEDDTHWGADTEMTVGGTKYRPVKETENKWDPLTIVMKHRGKLDVTAGMSDEEIAALDQKSLESYASQIKDHPAIKDEYTALGDWQYQENIERMIREELAKLLK